MSDWQEQAKCAGLNTEWWFATSAIPERRIAMLTCGICPVRTACLKAALDEEEGESDPGQYWGIRGGKTAHARWVINNPKLAAGERDARAERDARKSA